MSCSSDPAVAGALPEVVGVVVARVRCKRCGSVEVQGYKTRGRIRYYRCHACKSQGREYGFPVIRV